MTKKVFSLLYKKSVDKDLRKLPKDVRGAIIEKIQNLATSPFPPQSKKLRGSSDLYRLRYKDYRIIYEVHGSDVVIIVIKVGHRKEVYRDI
ncbi:MAG: type II toxin-antitoxin system RelE/ParE family toxin [Candidatus Saccharibacteria bacterium]